jgi:membrane protease subunit (stomatin/prohibitin family)
MPRIIDVVEFLDNTGTEIVHREPEDGPGDFRIGSQVIVRESQTAVFFRDGKALDLFGPGRHTITTYNIPIIASIINLGTSGRTPFPAEVVFVNMRQFIDQKWGTPEPITFRDPDFGMARLRAIGTYAYQVKDPSLVVNQIVGTKGIFTTGQIMDYLRGIIVQRFIDTLGEQKRSLLDLAGQYSETAVSVKAQLADDFAALGLALTAFYVSAITPTEETQQAIDARAAMGAIGDMNAYMKYKAAQALGDAANNQSGAAGAGVGLGAGIGLGGVLGGMLGQSMQQPQQAPPAAPAAPAADAPLTKAQVQQAIDALDMRFSKGEINEDTYNRMLARWEQRLKELGG